MYARWHTIYLFKLLLFILHYCFISSVFVRHPKELFCICYCISYGSYYTKQLKRNEKPIVEMCHRNIHMLLCIHTLTLAKCLFYCDTIMGTIIGTIMGTGMGRLYFVSLSSFHSRLNPRQLHR